MPDKKFNNNRDSEACLFDAAVVGGGLAGLALAILLAKSDYKVILFEKEKYPFHKVCGEYISMESWKFIESLGFDLSNPDLPLINKLFVSSPDGHFIQSRLDLGGFGISRYYLDNELKEIAARKGVTVCPETKVNDITFQDEFFAIRYNGGETTASLVAASFGKRSNLDVKWKRGFINKKPGKLNSYVGVKYHIKSQVSDDTIALHNFKNGYCGISKIEDGKCCLCYLTTAKNLKDSGNSIKEMEKTILYQNPLLKMIFLKSEFLFKKPVTISQISFDTKSQVESHMLMIGDAAGMITPLCGNGMSMAFHSAKIAFENMNAFLKKDINRELMEKQYTTQWRKIFESRLRIGRIIQKLFGKPFLTNIFIRTVKYFPFVIKKMIRITHGKEF